jgi:hypothetical protein
MWVDAQRREFLGVIMTPSLKIAASPILAFFDELRVFGFDRALTEGAICGRALE